MTLAAWVHNIDPFIFKITDTLGPRWYGFAYAMGFVVGYFVVGYVDDLFALVAFYFHDAIISFA